MHGLTRVRSFCQDDAHIFCTPEQLEGEIVAFNRLLFEVYAAFGFKDLAVKLALRPEKRIGSDELWDLAESDARARCSRSRASTFESCRAKARSTDRSRVPREGRDRPQLAARHDPARLRLPERFGLEFVGQDGAAHRPVMLHRAILGSLERFFGIYIEHVAGKFPVWLAPEQATLVTVSEKQTEYARTRPGGARAREGLRVDARRRARTSSAPRSGTRA